MPDSYLAFEKEAHFPNLRRGEYQVTSDETLDYNCIAHAADRNDNWWWPSGTGSFWPTEDGTETLEAFIEAYETEGYAIADPQSADLEAHFEKIAIYIDNEGAPSHAARQLADGSWTSKLGEWEDINHQTLQAIEDRDDLGLGYGKVAAIMKRPARQA